MFGKKEPVRLDKLKIDNTFKLFKTTWTITAIGEYDWRGDGRSVEYTISSNATEKAYLEVEFTKGDYEICFSKAINIDNALLQDAIISKNIIYLDNVFKLDETYSGSYKNLTSQSSWEHLESFIFYSEDDEMLTIEKWQDHTFEAFYGQEVSAKKIKNITTI